LANGTILATDSGPPLSSGKRASVPRANLGSSILSSNSSRQRGKKTNLKKASQTPANKSSKYNLAVMQEAD